MLLCFRQLLILFPHSYHSLMSINFHTQLKLSRILLQLDLGVNNFNICQIYSIFGQSYYLHLLHLFGNAIKTFQINLHYKVRTM